MYKRQVFAGSVGAGVAVTIVVGEIDVVGATVGVRALLVRHAVWQSSSVANFVPPHLSLIHI